MKNFKWWPAFGSVIAACTLLSACGGNGDSNSGSGSVRLVNATATHPSLDLLVNSSAAVSAVALDTVSGYVSVNSGSNALQINNAGQTTSLTTISPTLGGGSHYSVVAYEVSGTVKTAILPEDFAAPVSGTSLLRIFDAATDAGALDVYVTAPGADLSTISAPNIRIAASTVSQLLDPVTFTPGTYEVRVTGQDNKADLRADIKNVVIGSQEVGLVVLTPASGGILINGGTLIQQAAYTAGRNTTARVRLVSGVSGSATVSASVGAVPVATNAASPSVGTYAVVSATDALSVSVNNVAQTAPVTSFAAGSDNTLLVTGSPGASTVTVLADDNHLPADTLKVKVRLVNGTTGAIGGPLTLSFNFNTFTGAANIQQGTASTYGTVAIPSSSAGTEIDVISSLTAFSDDGKLELKNLGLTANSVYTLFVLGDKASSPFAQLSLDR